MAEQTARGKAFEYSCLNALKAQLEIEQNVVVETSPALKTALDFYMNTEKSFRSKLDKAANAAVRIIFRLEPQLCVPDNNVPLYLFIQEDARGVAGDVRDILCIRKQNEWEIGLSCKHNHSAVKHSRLSYTIDFGEMWFDKACSKQYFSDIKPIFDKLREEKNCGLKWKELSDKEDDIYVPLLNAFVKELRRLDAEYPSEIPPALLKYLLGKNDFYKVITHDAKKTTQIQAYNIFGTLNRSVGAVKAETKIPQLKLPTKFFDISYKPNSRNTVIVTSDNGWSLSFRIHNASSDVEPSLKFDVQLVGVPQSDRKSVV